MEVRKALADIAEIRAQLARSEVFRGYRSLTIGFSGVVGVLTAVVQALCLPRPMERWEAYLVLWLGAAAVNVAVVGFEIWSRAGAAAMAVTRQTTVFAVEQFVPSLVAGGLITLVIARRASEAVWMLPGVWAVLFSLGIFASCRLLPRAIYVAGAWYLICGVLALAWGQGSAALSPWIMGIIFGGGQLLTAVLLHITLEGPGERAD
jgi:hypothetical protein